MIAISCDRLGFSVGADDILSSVSFSLNEGDRLGIVGVNGAGKSTILRMISGSLEPTAGSVYIKKGASVRMLTQNETVESENTPYEELLSACGELVEEEKRLEELSEEMRRGSVEAQRAYHLLHDRFMEQGGYEYKSRMRGILRSLGFTNGREDTVCGKLSGGEKTRLALARILFSEPDILILDEPTNHLDTDTLVWLEDYLRAYRKTVLVVSHDRYFLDRVADKILDVEHCSAKLYSGNYSTFQEKKKKDREIAEKHYKNQQKEIERIEAYIALQHKWNRERNIIAAESRQKMLDRMEKLDRPENDPRAIRLSFRAGIESGNDVLKVRALSKGFPSKPLFDSLNFEVKKGDRLFIIGHNGCGKSTLMKILMHKLSADRGECAYGYNLTIGYYDQENQNLRDDNTVLDELWDQDPQMTQTRVRSALALFNFTGDDVGKKVSVLSGGERARLTFSKLVLKENNLLLLDEPTNHLDISSKEVLEDALAGYDGTVICVSHDRYFISKLANHILDFDGPSGVPCFFEGSYEDYQRYKSAKLSGAAVENPEELLSDNKRRYLENKKNQSDLRKMKNRLEKAGREAEETEALLDEIARKEESNASDYKLLSELQTAKEEAEEKLLSLLEEIENLEKALSTEA